MVAMLHNVVGLLNASMTIYDAWCDRAPVLIVGGTGPLDSTRRRGAVDWQHTAMCRVDWCANSRSGTISQVQWPTFPSH
jgi:hypothetical protein